jgi:hypothetical protein
MRTHKYKVGDVLECQGALVKIVGLIVSPKGYPAYEVVSPYTVGEPWLMDEYWLETSKKSRKKF